LESKEIDNQKCLVCPLLTHPFFFGYHREMIVSEKNSHLTLTQMLGESVNAFFSQLTGSVVQERLNQSAFILLQYSK